MPDVDSTTLKAHLQQLHSTLAQADQVDDELRILLAQLDGDIHQLLAQRGGALPVGVLATVAEPSSLAERTRAISARFAAQHPRLEPTLRQLSNMLANMGI